MIALIDITIGGAAVGVGIVAFMQGRLQTQLVIYLVMCSVSLVLAIVGLWALAKKNMRMIRLYFIWKCIELIVMPIFEFLIMLPNG